MSANAGLQLPQPAEAHLMRLHLTLSHPWPRPRHQHLPSRLGSHLVRLRARASPGQARGPARAEYSRRALTGRRVVRRHSASARDLPHLDLHRRAILLLLTHHLAEIPSQVPMVSALGDSMPEISPLRPSVDSGHSRTQALQPNPPCLGSLQHI